MRHVLEHITQENGKWFAEVITLYSNGTRERQHTGTIYGWDGMTYHQLKETLNTKYDIQIPTIAELELAKQTTCRKIYLLAA